MQIVDTNSVDRSFKSNLIGLAIMGATLDPAARHPCGERMGIVITTHEVFILRFLNDGQSSKLATTDYKGGIKEPALFKIGKQCADGLVGFACKLPVVAFDIAVPIPTAFVFHTA